MALVYDDSAPALVQEITSMWSSPPTQEDVETSRFDVFPSLQVASASNDIEFTIPNASDGWLTDLSQSYIKYALTVDVSANRLIAVTDVFSPLPHLSNTIWERASLTANGTIVNDETSMAFYQTHVHDLMSKSRNQYLAEDCSAWIPAPGTVDLLTASKESYGYLNSSQTKPDYLNMPTAAASPYHFGKTCALGDIIPVCNSKRLWPDRVSLRLRATRLPDPMLYAKEGTVGVAQLYTFVITAAELHVRRVKLTEHSYKHMVAEFGLGKKVLIPHLNYRTAVVNFQAGQTQLVARGVLPGAKPTRVIAFVCPTSHTSVARGWGTLVFGMSDPANPTVFPTRAFCETGGQTYPQRYMTSAQASAPAPHAAWADLDVAAAYQAYKQLAHPSDPVLTDADFRGRQMFCFDTSASGSSGEAVYDPTEQTDISVTLDMAAATGTAQSLFIISVTPRVISISASREIERI